MSDDSRSRSQINSDPDVKTLDSILAAIIRERDINRRSFRKIALMPEFGDGAIPPGTIHYIYNEQIIPRKWWGILKVQLEPTDRIAISKVDMQSAARTICRNIDPDLVYELSELLNDEIWR